MEIFRKELIPQLVSLIQGATHPVVLGHTHPDGDAMGSTLALTLFLRQMGKDATCILPDTPADYLQFIVPADVPYLYHDQSPQAAQERIAGADLVFLLDCNAFSRTEGLAPALEASTAPKVLIDHHLNPDSEKFNLVFSTPDISSASELLYWILDAMTGAEMSLAIGTALLIGMTTDTNNFANSVYPSTFQMASRLIAAGVNRDEVLDKIYRSYRENRVRLMGYMQYEGLHILPGGSAYMVLDAQTLQRFDLREGESEGLVNVPLTIGSVRLSVLAKEDGDHFRISVRSKKGTSAQKLAQQYFHGGGHENAAGGKIVLGQDVASAREVPAYIEQILNTFLP